MMLRFVRWLAVLTLVTALGLAAAPAALADALDDAKAKGLVGEQANGYLGIVAGGAPEAVRRLVDEINLKRREQYRGIAQRNDTSLNAVEAIAGKKLVEQAPSGQFVRDSTGAWKQVP